MDIPKLRVVLLVGFYLQYFSKLYLHYNYNIYGLKCYNHSMVIDFWIIIVLKSIVVDLIKLCNGMVL